MTTRKCSCGALLVPTIYKYGRSGKEVRWFCPNSWADVEHQEVKK